MYVLSTAVGAGVGDPVHSFYYMANGIFIFVNGV
jgi:hypothetical protein